MITFDDFKQLEIRMATIVQAEKIADTDRLLKVVVDLGDEKKELVAGIASQYQPEELLGKQVPVLCNLQPATIRGVESNGMILCATGPDPILLLPEKQVPNGCKVK